MRKEIRNRYYPIVLLDEEWKPYAGTIFPVFSHKCHLLLAEWKLLFFFSSEMSNAKIGHVEPFGLTWG